MTRRLVAVIAIQLALALAVALVVLDMRAHFRVERLGGVNVWGYRGAVMPEKRPGEIRIAVAGGDLAFGWGVASAETLAAYLRRQVMLYVNQSADREHEVTAVDIAGRGLLPDQYASSIEHFAYLKLDVICLLPDPPGHVPGDGRFLPDRHARVFLSTGYSPILPLVLREKAGIGHFGWLRPIASALAAADLQTDAPAARASSYDADIASAVRAARRVAVTGVVVVWPANLPLTAARIAAHDGRIRVERLDEHPAIASPDLLLDGYHFSAGGNAAVAEAVAPALTSLIQAARHRTS